MVGKVAKDDPWQHGTQQRFMPDVTIFKEGIDYKYETLVQRFREMAFLTRALTITFFDERDEHEMSFHFEGGVKSFVRYLNKSRTVLHPPVYTEKQMNGTSVEAAIQYTDMLHGIGVCLCQQHQHHRWRHARHRLPIGADAHAERLRAQGGPAEGFRSELQRRRCARGLDGHHLRSSCKTRSSSRRPNRSWAMPK